MTAKVTRFFQEEPPARINGENGWYVPQKDGSHEWVDKNEGLKRMDQLRMDPKARILFECENDYYLYTRANPFKGQRINATVKSINTSNFNPKNPTRFLIHGYLQSYTDKMNKDITKAWLQKGDYNIIAVDWECEHYHGYTYTRLAVDSSGEHLAEFIDFLVKKRGMSLSTLKLIGHSLGAHVAGIAGKTVKSGKIHTIVGLDPASPLFVYEWPSDRLANSDAIYVETIHTNGGNLGFLRPIGTASFYPNGGEQQPGCGTDLFGICSHMRSFRYFAEGVLLNNFVAYKCLHYKDAIKKRYENTNSSVKMASPNFDPKVFGVFYVPVKNKSPHGMG